MSSYSHAEDVSTAAAIGRLEGKVDGMMERLPNLMSKDTCSATVKSITDQLQANQDEIVRAVNGEHEHNHDEVVKALCGVMTKGLTLIGAGLGTLTTVLYYFIR